MKARKLVPMILAGLLALGLALTGCSNKGDLLQQVSGQWQDNQNHRPIEINLAGDAKSMTVNGQTYPVTVEAVEMMNYVVNLKVQNGSPQPEKWTLRQIWDENGSKFKLAFSHSGEKEVLIPKSAS